MRLNRLLSLCYGASDTVSRVPDLQSLLGHGSRPSTKKRFGQAGNSDSMAATRLMSSQPTHHACFDSSQDSRGLFLSLLSSPSLMLQSCGAGGGDDRVFQCKAM